MSRNSKYYQTKEFKDLNDKWQKKLKAKGFEDIEQKDGNLKTWAISFLAPSRMNAARVEENKNREDYYRLAGQFLHDHKFKTPVEKRIWQLHSEGMSIVDIVTTIQNSKRYRYVYRRYVHETIRDLVKEMTTKLT